MLFLFPEQLEEHLQHNSLHPCYILLGNDHFLLQDSQEHIRAKAQALHFYSFNLNENTDWNAIFSLYQSYNLFNSSKTILLTFPEKGINAEISKNLSKLSSLMQLHTDILLILRSSYKLDEKSFWFKTLSNNSVMVNCATPEQIQMQRWVIARSKYMKLSIDKKTCKLLCYYYNGNLLGLAKILEILSLIYTDGNLTMQRVKEIIFKNNTTAHFTPFHWVDATLAGKSKRAIYILQQLRLIDSKPAILLRNSQSAVLLLIKIKYQIANCIPVNKLFDKYKILHKKRRIILNKALNNLNIKQLQQAVLLMTRIEFLLKQEHSSQVQVWSYLSTLSLLLCGKSFAILT